VSFNVGIAGIAAGEPAVRVNHAATDFGILFRNSGGTQYFDNGVATTGGNFDVTTVAPHHVTLQYNFNTFADNGDVLVSASVDGVNVLSNFAFKWEGNLGESYMELGNLAAGTRIDNFAISTVPEPSTMAMLGAGALLLGWRMRRR
jgi:hypothetical protein